MSGKNREKILAGATEYCFTYGLGNLRMEELAHYIGLSKKTLYNHFRNKDVIVHEVFSRTVHSIEEDLEAILRRQDELIPCFRTLVVYGLNKMEEMSRFFSGKVNEAETRNAERRVYRLLRKHIRLLLEQGISRGMVNPQVPLELFPDLILSIIDGCISHFNGHLQETSSRDLFHQSLTLLFQGALTEEGNRVFREIGV